MQGKKRIARNVIVSIPLLLIACFTRAQTFDEAAIKGRLQKEAGRIGLSAAAIPDAIITKTFTGKSSGIEYIYLQQTVKGIPIYNSIKTVAFKSGKLVYSSGEWISTKNFAVTDTTTRIEAIQALRKAAVHLGLASKAILPSLVRTEFRNHKKSLFFSPGNVAKRDIEVELYWAPDSLQKLHLAWNVSIDVADSPDWWNVRVDAKSGEIIGKNNWTTYENNHLPETATSTLVSTDERADKKQYLAPPNSVNNASYYVVPFPADNLNVKPFTTVNNPWQDAGSNNNATTYGWHYDGTTTYNISRGNNVYAYEDTASKNKPGAVATSVTALPDLSFNFHPDFTQSTSTLINTSAAITNLFYWNNLMHDVMYQYGFDEASGNFQASNIGRGGTGNDPVMAEAQDGSGSNNSNFSTPADGTSGRMQMYLWNVSGNTHVLSVTAPASIAGTYANTESGFSNNNKLANVGPVSDTVALYTPDTLACSATLSTVVKGKIALIYRGSCNFTDKVFNAQKAGAVGVIMVNRQDSAYLTMGGSNDSITIPAVLVSYTDGILISNTLKSGSTVTATLASGPLTDGDFDNGIICHEYGHGISHRLTGGNVSCLSNAERPDEGWSDYFALMMTQDWKTTTLADSAKGRTIGTYVFGQAANGSGIRRYPYSTNFTTNPHTYAEIKTDGEVHDIGEIWCSALWDMTWNIIKQEGTINKNLYDAAGNGGNSIALKLVIEGEKLQPCSPGFLDARDAILAADSILYNGKHKCNIWNAFARRGMGASALQGSSASTTDGTAAFDLPILRLRTDSLPAISDLFTTKITVTCECALPPAGYKLVDTVPSAFRILSTSPAATVKDSIVTFDAGNFTSPGQSNIYSVTLVPDATAGCAKDTVVYDNRDNHTGGGFASSAATGTTGWTVSTAQAYSPTHAWYAADPEAASDFSLTSNTFVPGKFSVLSFRHRFTTEAGYDGGMVDISTNGGTSWTGTAPYFIRNGYNGIIYSFNPFDTTYGTTPMPAFTGTFKDSGFTASYINLSAFAGKAVKMRFRMYTDIGTSYDGWYVDDIILTNGCGGVQRIGLYSNLGKVISTLRSGTFNVDSNGVVQPAFGDVTAANVNNLSVSVTWTTVSEHNVASFVVEHSTDSLSFTTITTTGALGAGSNYTYSDVSLANGANYYRIRMLDAAGNTLATSPVVKVTVSLISGGIGVVPNPSVSQATVLIEASFNAKALSVYDMTGKRVLTATLSSGTTSYTINSSALAGGIYIVAVQSVTGEVRKVKMLVQRR